MIFFLTIAAITLPKRIKIKTITSAQRILSMMPPISIPIRSVSVDDCSTTSSVGIGFIGLGIGM